MIPKPENRAVSSGDVVTRAAARPGGSGGTPAKRESTSVQAHRAMATVAEVLGRDPKRTDIFVGGTRLIERLAK